MFFICLSPPPDDFDEGDYHKVAPRFSHETFSKTLRFVNTGTYKAEGIHIWIAFAAWLLHHGDDIFPFPQIFCP